jgi:hypothetical protein
LTPPEFI